MEWREIDAYCIHCGMKLEARLDRNGQPSMVLKGCEPMEYRHVGGAIECPPIVYKAEPYSNWNMFNLWKKADKTDKVFL